jgi:hypothetical protein
MILSFINRFRLSNLITNQTTINLFRYTSVNVSSSLTDGEKNLNEILKKRFSNARFIHVKDTSCKYRILLKQMNAFLILS